MRKVREGCWKQPTVCDPNAGQCTFQQRLAVQMISSQVFQKKAVEATAALILYAAGSSHLPRREESQSNALDFSSALACQDPI